MITFGILGYDRPIESELCIKSIRKNAKFDHEIVYISNGGNQDYAINLYKNGLIDKLILRKSNSGCGLGTREVYNDFNLNSDYLIYIQCDQFLCREFSKDELYHYLALLQDGKYMYIDLAGNQAHGRYSERAQLMSKKLYNSIPNSIGGPGPFANRLWTEESIENYRKNNGLSFLTVNPVLFADNGKISRREYPCGGVLVQHTDEKSVFIEKPIKVRIDFPNVHLTDEEWDKILNNTWVNGTIPEKHRNDSFVAWNGIYCWNKDSQ